MRRCLGQVERGGSAGIWGKRTPPGAREEWGEKEERQVLVCHHEGLGGHREDRLHSAPMQQFSAGTCSHFSLLRRRADEKRPEKCQGVTYAVVFHYSLEACFDSSCTMLKIK